MDWILNHGFHGFYLAIIAVILGWWKVFPWVRRFWNVYSGVQAKIADDQEQLSSTQEKLIAARAAERDQAAARCKELECKVEDLTQQLYLSEQKAVMREDFSQQDRAKNRLFKRLLTAHGIDFEEAEKDIERRFGLSVGD